jgi:hypothetical protein
MAYTHEMSNQRGIMQPRKPLTRLDKQRQAVEDIKRAKALLEEAKARYREYDRPEGA